MKCNILTLLVVLLACVGCKVNPSTEENGKDAYVSFDINAIEIDVEAGTKASAQIPSVGDFTITISPKGSSVASHSFLYKNRPAEPIRLEPGEYTFSCYYGDATVQTSATPVYNETKLLNLGGSAQSQTVKFTPKRTHYCFEVVYPIGFDQHYTNYRVSVSSAALGTALEFGGSEQPAIHYFKIGSEYTATLLATKKNDNSAVSTVLAQIIANETKTYHQLNLLFPAPKFTSATNYTLVETLPLNSPSDITFTSPVSEIAKVEVTFNFANPELASSLNETYTLDAATIASLAGKGVSCTVNANSGSISLSNEVKNKMLSYGNVNTNYIATVTVTDVNGRATSQTTTYTVEPPVFEIPDMQNAFWSKTLDSPTLSEDNITKGTASTILAGMSYKVSTDGVNWIAVTKNNDQLFVTNLTHNTNYILAATYRDITVTRTFRTEEQIQVPNAGFEEWNMVRTSFGSKFPNYRPWGGSVPEFWNTCNPRCQTYNGVPTQYNNPTSVLYTTNGKNGRAAELRSVRISVGGRVNVAGKLVTGTLTSINPNGLITGTQNPEYLTEGRPFGSRPTKIRFWYKYQKYNTDNFIVTARISNGSTILAEKIITSDEAKTEYTEMVLDLPYSRTDMVANKIYICFQSSKGDDNFDTYTYNFNYYPEISTSEGKWSVYCGSIMWIDDVELIYEK